MTAKIKDEYYINVKGGRHPVWEGVLIALHESGLLGIEVNVLQYPAAANQNTAVCQATVTLPGPDGRELIFSEVGDASPASVGSMIAPHIIRMAATRAKGRAGRDALGCGEALAEELGPDGPATSHGDQPGPQRARYDPEDHRTRKAAEIASHAVCAVCGDMVTPAVAKAAVAQFAEVLCIPHGKERRERRTVLEGRRVPDGGTEVVSEERLLELEAQQAKDKAAMGESVAKVIREAKEARGQ